MTMSEKLAALSDPKVSVHYSSLPDVEILRLWDTTRLKDTKRYFLYREILRRGLESHLLNNQRKKCKILPDKEYLIAEYKEGGLMWAGFVTLKSNLLYLALIFLPGIVGFTMGSYLASLGESWVPFGDNNWLFILSLWLVILCLMLVLLGFSNLLTQSYLFVTNQRIGYYRKILRIIKLSPKWLDLNDGHLISGTYQCSESFLGALLGISTKEKALKEGEVGFRLDRYDHSHQRINCVLNLMIGIYLLELLQLISSKTKAVVYNTPILYPKSDHGDLLLNYRFRDSQLEDLNHFFKTIDRSGILKAKNKTYGGKTNMERLASFFKAIEAIDLGSQSGEPSPDNPETILAYLPGSLRGLWKSPLICLTTTGVKYYELSGDWEDKWNKFSYRWSDPNLTVGISTVSANIMYKKKIVINMYWDIIDVPIVDIFQILGLQQIYSNAKISYWDGAGIIGRADG